MNIIHLKQSLSAEGISAGEIKGIAYSGSVIKNHGFIENLIIELSTLTVAKGKTPIFRDHMPFQVAGQGVVTIGDDVRIEGKISKKNAFGKEIIDLAEDGFEWEMSLGVYGGDLIEIEDETINGIHMNYGVVLRGGEIREVSVVALGADKNTSAEVFNVKTKDSNKGESLMLNKEQWIKLACGCGGTKDTTPEELEAKFTASKEEADKAKMEIEELKKQIAEKQAIIDSAKEEKEFASRTEEINLKVKEKGLEIKPEVIEKAAKSVESKDMFLSMIEGMEVVKKIDPKFVDNLNLGKDPILNKEDPNSIQLRANQLVAEGKAADFLTALQILGEK